MSLSNPNKPVTEQRLSEFYQGIYPYLGGMPELVANKFDKGNLYSTDERMIGQWTDGKPIYQKTFYNITPPQVTTSGTSVNKYIEIGATIDQVIDIKAISTLNNSYYTLPTTWGQNTSNFVRVDVNNNATSSNKNSLNISCNSTSTNTAIINVSLQYTKTTDSAISIGNDTDYSTTEKIVGTWIDGKPIYQKTISCGIFSASSSSKTVPHNISNLERVVNISGFARNSNSGTSIPLPMQQHNLEIGIWASSTVINIEWDGDRSAITESYIILQYTKTS